MAQAPATEPERCEQCSLCDWRERCSAQWQAQDHLNGVANITKVQIKRLRTHGIHTMAELGALVPSASVPGMPSESLESSSGCFSYSETRLIAIFYSLNFR